MAPCMAALAAARAVASSIVLPVRTASAAAERIGVGAATPSDDRRLTAVRSVHDQHDAGICKGPIEALLLAIFLIRGACTGLWRRHEDAGDQFARLYNGLVDEALLGRNVEVAHGNGALASLRCELHLRIHREQRHGGRGGMHHRAGPVVHNGVVLILAAVRVTVVAGSVLLLAVEVAGSEVPAAWALHDIAAKRRHIAYLRRRRVTGSIRQRCVAFLDLRMSSNLAQSRQRSEVQAILADGDAAKTADVADIDELRRRDDAILHQVQQIDAACLDDSAIAELTESLVYRRAIDECKLVHACTSCTFPSALSTFAGVIGILRMRTPGCVVERIADRGGQRNDARRFANAGSIGRALRNVILDQDNLDLRDLARAENLVVFKICVQHVTGIAVHNALLEESIRDALQDAAVDLADDTQGIDGTSAVVSTEDLLDMHSSGLGIDGEFDIIDPAVGDSFLRVFGDACCLAEISVGRQLRRYLLQRVGPRSIVLQDNTSVLQNEIVGSSAELRSNCGEELLLRLIRRVAGRRCDRASRDAASGVRPDRKARVANANARRWQEECQTPPQRSIASMVLVPVPRSCTADISSTEPSRETRTSHDEFMLTKRYQTDCAIPMPRLIGPAIGAGGLAIAPVRALKDDLPLDLASRIFVDLFAEGQRVHLQLGREFIDGLFKRKAALRMARRTERRTRTSVDKDVVLLGEQIRALVHVGRRTGGAGSCTHACRAVACELDRSQRPIMLRTDLQLLMRVRPVADDMFLLDGRASA